MGIKYGCHGYTWQMSYEEFKGDILHILDIIQEGGFKGIDTQVVMLGKYYDKPDLFKKELEKRQLQLPALTLPLKWRYSKETNEERNLVDHFISYIKKFPNPLLNIVPTPESDRSNLKERQKNILSCANEVAKRATSQGVSVSLHPNSSPGSVFKVKEDYKVMFDGMNTDLIGYTPDAGHIAKGGMDVYEIFEQYREFIKHIHFKDIDSNNHWAAMGDGIIDFEKIVNYLNQTNYTNWIMVEEESKKAEKDPDNAMRKNSKYVKRNLINPYL